MLLQYRLTELQMHKENREIVVENAELIYDFEDVENYELAKG